MVNSSYIEDRAKYALDLERYKCIVDYFEDLDENLERIPANKNQLIYLADFLGEVPIQDYQNLANRIRFILSPELKNLKEKLDTLSLAKNLKQRMNNNLKSDIVSEIKNPNKEKKIREKKGSIIDQWIGELI